MAVSLIQELGFLLNELHGSRKKYFLTCDLCMLHLLPNSVTFVMA